VAIVIDASGSMKRQDPSLLSKVAAKLFIELAGPQDEVGVVEFGTTARLIDRAFVTGPQARRKLFEAVDRVGRSQECTDYLAGLEKALEMFSQKPAKGERRLIIFLTDGTYDPNRSNGRYYELLDEKKRAAVWGEKPRELWEKLQKGEESERFRKRPCRSRYDELAPAARAGFQNAFAKFLKEQLAPSGARVFTIGFGTALAGSRSGRGTGQVKESIDLLRSLAKVSRGRTLIEHDVDKIPGFFSEIFAALVGAPVEGFPSPGNKPSESYDFEVVEGTSALSVVVPTSGDPNFDVGLRRNEKTTPAKKRREVEIDRRTAHNEVGRERRKGQVLAGYRFLRVSNPEPGTYSIYRKAGRQKTFEAQVITDVGLRLAWLEPEPKKVYAQSGTGSIEASFGLRTGSGKKVAGLSRKFMKDMRFFWQIRQGSFKVIHGGKVDFDPSRPMKPMKLRIPRAMLDEGTYTLEAWARHAKGFFELRRLIHELHVVKYIEMEVEWSVEGFETKTREGFRVDPWVTLRLEKDIKAPQEFQLDLSSISNRGSLALTLSNTTPECRLEGKKIKGDTATICLHEKKGEVTIALELKSWERWRSKSGSFSGTVTLTPEDPDIFKNKKKWSTKTEGRLIAWTFWDWVRFYRNWIIAGAILLVVLLWVVGRAFAGAFPPKATLYYKDLEEGIDEPSRYALGRRAKSRLPFVSASHQIGGKGTPRSGRVLCTLKASPGGGFRILPKAMVSYERDGEREETRQEVRGRFGEHYVADERYEIWVTRTPDYDI
jgi:hypothetical protein